MRTLSTSTLLVTGGMGFMGSDFIRYLLCDTDFRGKIVNVDLLSYAANPENLKSIHTSPRYAFIQVDITNAKQIDQIILENEVDFIINFAAETHVDRSIAEPSPFMDTNIRGTYTLLEAIRMYPHIHFHQISTDEVYGSLGEGGTFTESSSYRPNSPYAASKASADHLVRAYINTYKISATLSHSANNYGPYQFPEKFIPLMITNALRQKSLPVYGKGINIRNWIFVRDHSKAIYEILQKGRDSYNIGGLVEISNIDLLKKVLKILAEEERKSFKEYEKLITFTDDRAGHDFRYSLDTTKIERELGFYPMVQLEEGLRKTVRWYKKTGIKYSKCGA